MDNLLALEIDLFKERNFDFITKKNGLEFPKQEEALLILTDSTTVDLTYGGAAGGSKSWTGCEWEIFSCLAYPETKWFIGREELKRLRDSTLLTFFKVCKEHDIIRDEHFRYNGQDHFIEFYNGSRIDLLDLKFLPSDPLYERYGSVEYTGGWIEEAGEVHFGAYDTLKSRVGRHLNDKYNLLRKIFKTCNPKKNWLYLEYKAFKSDTLDDDCKFIQAFAQDNPYNESGYMDALLSIKDKSKKERLLYGNWEYDDDPAKLMEYDNIVNLFTNDFVGKDEKGELKPCLNYITADIARFGSDKTVVMVWKGLRLIYIKSYDRTSITDSADIITELAIKYEVPRSRICVDEDGLGCMIKGTQVLTTNGFTDVEKLKHGDRIYSKDSQGIIIEEEISVFEKRKNCEAIRTKQGYGFSAGQMMRYKTRLEYDFKLGSWDKVSGSRSYLDIGSTWIGKDKRFKIPSVTYEMPHGGIKDLKNEINIKLKDFAAFLGWFMSDGGIGEGRYMVIRQKIDNGNKCEVIESILNRCGFRFNKKIDKSGVALFAFGHKNLLQWLTKNCYNGDRYCQNIKVPNIIRNATISTIKEFLYHFRLGDGWLHHGMDYYGTSSKQMADDLQELIYKTGVYPGQKIKMKAGSKSTIHGRVITRKHDHYYIYQTQIKNIIFSKSPEDQRTIEDVYFMDITGDTHLFLVKTDNNRMMWVHNGGVKDILKCKGFVANSTPIPIKGQKLNFNNLKSQCYFKLADMVNAAEIYIDSPDTTVTDMIIEELEVVKQKDVDKDNKMAVISKDRVKELIGRSPDYSDTLMMRMFLELSKSGILATS